MESLRILLVEDNLIEAYDVRQTLEQAGHVVTAHARNFTEALLFARQNPPDVALIDITLDRSSADGIGTAQAIRRICDAPIVYMTANSDNETFQRAKPTLPAAYVLKPFKHNELAYQIELAYYHRLINQPTPDNDLFLPIRKGHERVAKSSVIFLKAAGAYTRILVADEPNEAKSHLLSMNLGYLSQFFVASNFFKVSRSLVVNLDYLERLERDAIHLKHTPDPLPLPESSRAELMKTLLIVKSK